MKVKLVKVMLKIPTFLFVCLILIPLEFKEDAANTLMVFPITSRMTMLKNVPKNGISVKCAVNKS